MILWCGRCKTNKPTEAFHKCVSTKTGYQSRCKDCQKEHVQSRSVHYKAYHKAYAKAYYQNSPNRYRRMGATFRKNSAIKRGSPKETAELIFYDEVYKRDKGTCQICKLPCGFEQGQLDHIISCERGGDHTYSNVQLAHGYCNKTKGL